MNKRKFKYIFYIIISLFLIAFIMNRFVDYNDSYITVIEPCVDGLEGKVINQELLCEHQINPYDDNNFYMFFLTLSPIIIVILAIVIFISLLKYNDG